MLTFSPAKEVRLGMDQIAEKNPRKAHLLLARRNVFNALDTALKAPAVFIPLELKVAGDVLGDNPFAQFTQGKQPELFTNPVHYLTTMVDHDPVANALRFGTEAVLAIAALQLVVGGGGRLIASMLPQNRSAQKA